MNSELNYESIAYPIPNYKLIGDKYYIKHYTLGHGVFTNTTIATLKEDENIVLACKQIEKLFLFNQLNQISSLDVDILSVMTNLKKKVEIWKQFNHCNVVQFIKWQETVKNLYLFIEYCNGKNLDMMIRARGQLSEAESITILQQILDGCSYLHDQEYFLMELKPQNILFHHGEIKLEYCDVRVLESDKRKFAFSNQQQYMAPQILSGEDYSLKCDVWSIGVILYQMLFGMIPWKGIYSDFCLLEEIKKQKIEFPNSNPISDGMKELILMMLQIREEDRCSIKDVYEKLKTLQN